MILEPELVTIGKAKMGTLILGAAMVNVVDGPSKLLPYLGGSPVSSFVQLIYG